MDRRRRGVGQEVGGPDRPVGTGRPARAERRRRVGAGRRDGHAVRRGGGRGRHRPAGHGSTTPTATTTTTTTATTATRPGAERRGRRCWRAWRVIDSVIRPPRPGGRRWALPSRPGMGSGTIRRCRHRRLTERAQGRRNARAFDQHRRHRHPQEELVDASASGPQTPPANRRVAVPPVATRYWAAHPNEADLGAVPEAAPASTGRPAPAPTAPSLGAPLPRRSAGWGPPAGRPRRGGSPAGRAGSSRRARCRSRPSGWRPPRHRRRGSGHRRPHREPVGVLVDGDAALGEDGSRSSWRSERRGEVRRHRVLGRALHQRDDRSHGGQLRHVADPGRGQQGSPAGRCGPPGPGRPPTPAGRPGPGDAPFQSQVAVGAPSAEVA